MAAKRWRSVTFGSEWTAGGTRRRGDKGDKKKRPPLGLCSKPKAKTRAKGKPRKVSNSDHETKGDSEEACNDQTEEEGYEGESVHESYVLAEMQPRSIFTCYMTGWQNDDEMAEESSSSLSRASFWLEPVPSWAQAVSDHAATSASGWDAREKLALTLGNPSAGSSGAVLASPDDPLAYGRSQRPVQTLEESSKSAIVGDNLRPSPGELQ